MNAFTMKSIIVTVERNRGEIEEKYKAGFSQLLLKTPDVNWLRPNSLVFSYQRSAIAQQGFAQAPPRARPRPGLLRKLCCEAAWGLNPSGSCRKTTPSRRLVPLFEGWMRSIRKRSFGAISYQPF